MATREQTLIAVFAGMEALHAYSAFNPSIMTIRKFADDADAVKAIRQGEMLATAFTVILGWVLSEITDSYLPLIFTVAAALAYVTVYEFALRGTLDLRTVGNAGRMTAATVIPGVSPPFS